MYRQVLDPFGSLTLSALVAALPLLALLILLGVFRMKSHWAGLAGLALSLVLAVVFFGMPVGQAADGALEGAAFGLFPIVWIILNAVWINKIQRTTRYWDVLGRAFSSLSNDFRIQAILVAYCFGSMIESLSGFGTPIAVTSVMLIALGLQPLKAAAVATFANTAPAAFGSVGNPIQALAKVTSFPADDLASMVGRQSAFVAAIVPLVLLLMLDGRRGLREVWPAALTAGIGFGIGQFLCSNFFAYQLTDLSAAIFSTILVIVLLKVWSPGRGVSASRPAMALSGAGQNPTSDSDLASEPPRDGTAATEPADEVRPPDSRRDVVVSFTPYVLLTVLFALTEIKSPVQRAVASVGVSFEWPGLSVVGPTGKSLSITTFDFGWLAAAGTMLLLTGVLTALVMRVGPRRAARCYREAFGQIRWAVLTISSVLALSYVMNLSGMAISLGTWLAGIGGAFALLSGFLGWFGVALTGSDTSSNALFGAMQVAAAHRIGVSPLLLAATNSTGGVQGKAAAMQNLCLAASAVGMPGREGDILRKVLGWSLALLALFCLFAYLQTSVLSWMVP
ncbi:MAG TPA: L-lactate permease [Pseudonocardiaceae bacterium]|jgi:lactate permease